MNNLAGQNDDKFVPYNLKLKRRSQEMRREMTRAERRLWYDYLKNHKLRFARQKPIDHYIPDFYCSKARLVIEIDGDSHFSEQGIAYDEERTRILDFYGLKVVRFTNQEVMENFQGVVNKIEEAISTTGNVDGKTDVLMSP